jgi:hypothetical protein
MGASSVVRSLRVAIVFGLVAAGLIVAGAARASAATCESWGGQPPDVGSGDNQLQDVAATSACNALAVGYYNNGTAFQTLILHWSGKAWRVQQSKDPGGSSEDNELSGVAATSSNNAWAVGSYSNGTADQTLIEHWNGKTWKVQPSLNPGGPANPNDLSGVAATSSTNAWAVGSYFNGTATQTLIEHWNGKKWSVQPSPSPSGACAVPRLLAIRARTIGLSSVAATSSSNAWAVGIRCGRAAIHALIEHWNGKAWKVQPSPNADPTSAQNALSDVAASSSTNAWAVGSYGARLADPPVVERWNGKVWKIQPSSNFPNGVLFGVAAISSGDAWAVGSWNNGTNLQNLILHCC